MQGGTKHEKNVLSEIYSWELGANYSELIILWLRQRYVIITNS
jgi:hypothetical protein